VYYQQYVKNPQLRTSAFYPLHPQISSAKIIRILPVSASARPQICTSTFYHWPNTGGFGIRNIRSQDYSFPGTFVPMMELSFSGPFVPWNFRSQDYSFPGTFVPWTVRSLELSFLGPFVPGPFVPPIPNLTRKIHSPDYDRSNTSFIVYVK